MQAMAPRVLILFAVALLSAPALAEPPRPASEGERAPRPEGASNARVGGWCDALTGEKKEQCLREESRKRREQSANGERSGTCDALSGPEKDRCLRRGGTIEVDARADPRGSAGAAASQ